jgi:mRNA-degrading endonuclease YafQ of YafQ-DinJ toxin-antitoxin module
MNGQFLDQSLLGSFFLVRECWVLLGYVLVFGVRTQILMRNVLDVELIDFHTTIAEQYGPHG